MLPSRFLLASVCAVVVLSVCVNAAPRWHELGSYSFEKYSSEFSKVYASAEETAMRRSIFEEQLHKIMTHNRDHTQTYKMGVNHLTDRTPEEIKKMLGYKPTSRSLQGSPAPAVSASLRDLPSEVDWRLKGIVTSPKDQGQCGSCWTFASASVVESAYALAKGNLPTLSEQQILDCVDNSDHCGGTGGCEGGVPQLAYQKIIDQGGLATEWTYPYRSYYGQDFTQCLVNSSSSASVATFARLSSFVTLPANQYEPVMQAVASIGTLAVNVDASTWHLYESGVFNSCNQTNPDVNHVVQLVGYGADKDLGEYWLVRNSWGSTWGEQGYIRLHRSDKESSTCGTDLTPQDGTGCSGGPSTVTVCGTCGILYDVSYPIVA